jgi:hypothetical protein
MGNLGRNPPRVGAVFHDVGVILTSSKTRVFRYVSAASGNIVTQIARAIGRLERASPAIPGHMNQILRIGRDRINASCIGSIVEARHWSI